jgi:hypothetical protein
MIGWGILLIVLGAGSLLLPQMGFQFRLMELLDDFQPYAGVVVGIIGIGLVVLGMRQRNAAAVPAGPPPSQDPPSQP